MANKKSEMLDNKELDLDFSNAIFYNSKIKFLIGLPLHCSASEWSNFLDKYKEYIYAIYFSIPLGERFQSRLIVNDYLKSEDNVTKYYQLLKVAIKKNLKLELVLNTYGLKEEDIKRCELELNKEGLTIDNFTIIDNYYYWVRKYFPNAKINYSFNNYFNDFFDISSDKHYDGIIFGRYQIRNIELMERVKKEFNSEPIVLLNNGCNHFCGWCHNFSHCKTMFEEVIKKYNNDYQYLYSLFSIIPQELDHYLKRDITIFKISNRTSDLAYLRKCIDSYLNNNSLKYINESTNNYNLWARLRWLEKGFKEFDYNQILKIKNDIWKKRDFNYKELQLKNDLMIKKGIIVDLSDKEIFTSKDLNEIIKSNCVINLPYKIFVKGVVLGSSTCSRFIKKLPLTLLIEKLTEAKNLNLETYFVLPNIRNDFYLDYINLIDKLLGLNLIDHLIVNDYGIINHYHHKIDIITGRLFDKRIRDFRIKDTYIKTQGIGMFASENLNFLDSYGINKITIEPLLPTDFKIPNQISKVYVNYPEILVSSGNICEFSGIGLEDKYKFKNDICSFKCLDYDNVSKYQDIEVKKIMNAIYYVYPRKSEMLESLLNNEKIEIIIKSQYLGGDKE